jgi:hypothetical protein
MKLKINDAIFYLIWNSSQKNHFFLADKSILFNFLAVSLTKQDMMVLKEIIINSTNIKLYETIL